MSRFQIVLLAVFGFFIIVAVLTFALYRGSGTSTATVTIWGDYPASEFNIFMNASGLQQDRMLTIDYEEKSPETINKEWTEALAQGVGPDLIIISQDKFWENRAKLIPMPYSSVSERDFQDTFVEAAEIFLTAEGVYALPISIDPLVLYYNRDILSTAGISNPLAYWDQIYEQTTDLTRRDAAGNISQSTIALGTTGNIENAKDILSLLFLQAGNPITRFVGEDLRSALADVSAQTVRPADATLDFYTQFSNPTKSYYSWNRSQASAQSSFTTGDSAYYIGFASELRELRGKSPTLNFAVASVPQSRVSGRAVTYGELKGVAISRGSLNPAAALAAALKLVSKESSLALTRVLFLPSARRDILSERPTDSVWPIFYNSALQSKSWIDPAATETRELFYSMVDDITSGRARTTEAVNSASRELDLIIK